MDYSKYIEVDCAFYGIKKLSYPTSMEDGEIGQQLLKYIESNWSSYWPILVETTSEMSEQVFGIYDFNASFETNDFRVEIYDMRKWEDPDLVPIWLQFLDSNSKDIVPVFDTTFHKFEVSHCQPVF